MLRVSKKNRSKKVNEGKIVMSQMSKWPEMTTDQLLLPKIRPSQD